GLGRLLDDVRQVAPEQEDRQAEGEERGRMAEAPGGAEPASDAGRTPARIRDERRDGHEVIGIGGVPKAEAEGEQEDHDRPVPRRVRGDVAIDPAHCPFTRSSPSVGTRLKASWLNTSVTSVSAGIEIDELQRTRISRSPTETR